MWNHDMEQESDKIIGILKVANEQHRTFMEETWNERIPVECSTPKMLSWIWKEIEMEFRRNSISMAKGFKQKGSPLSNDEKNRRTRHSSISDLFQF